MTDQLVVLITGGSSGIGLETARRFGREGNRVFITARNEERLDSARVALERDGIAVAHEAGSVTCHDDVRRVVKKAVATFGKIDVLISNAASDHNAPLLDMDEYYWDEIFDTNCKGSFMYSREVGRHMTESGTHGVILITSSINSQMPEAMGVPYAASKAALDVLVRGLAIELAPSGIRVCGVSPGYTDTPAHERVFGESTRDVIAAQESKIPMKRFAHPRELAAAFWFLASSEASYITGTNLVVDGGRVLAS